MKRFYETDLEKKDGKDYFLKDIEGNIYVPLGKPGITMGLSDLIRERDLLESLTNTNNGTLCWDGCLTTSVPEDKIVIAGNSFKIRPAYIVQGLKKIVCSKNNNG